MNEKLLQFIWQFGYFNNHQLQTETGQKLLLLQRGTINHEQGADFTEAKIKLDDTTWVGNIEIHIRASDWYKHKHCNDAHYNNVILHVVWQQDAEVKDTNGNILPTLVIQPLVSNMLLERHSFLMQSQSLPCQHAALSLLSKPAWGAWKERLLLERLNRKANKILLGLEKNKQHWEASFWQTLAANFGITTNAALFENIAHTLPLSILEKHRDNLLQIESLLMGQANLLESNFITPYPLALKKEYAFLKQKYQLPTQPILPKFLRMRPACFPTLRLSQLAMLVHQSARLFSIIMEEENIGAIRNLFTLRASAYWDEHYTFSESSPNVPKRLGNSTVDNIIINTIVPTVFCYGTVFHKKNLKAKAILWLQSIKKENNTIVRKWETVGEKIETAADSQAMIELTKIYCANKKCLECSVGNNFLRTF